MRDRWPPRPVVRSSSGLSTMESVLGRAGLGPVAGIDEAGRGACAGPMTVAACILPRKIPPSLARLDDSKKLSEIARERLYPEILKHAVSWSVVTIPAAEVDRLGVHVANISGMRRAIATLQVTPGYVLIDGFTVPGLGIPSLPVIGGDASASCIAAASVLAKVTRDRVMAELDADYDGYGFAVHKGYSTAAHMAALGELGPSDQHRMRYQNVRAALRATSNEGTAAAR
ncbi:ribonuclease HII [Tsukamurella paurometabola]|uniref:Ribonuclease HII n=1 Tax=Tsukamurella paurometabola (strain ATCC 8368 / DSM 20162 / CCUG 35730 / CIP 100753 / JCM 10117 / KCTC 9821 / NBRC 16120 / NCIMB 702349 / NCTC 13040) TaxID=521096 RepID=D5UYE6_TSUPD|nr:ribonuclease HII [Tsukamurella paurometabola]ADG78253.1 Ribonuclease H [Tsukamurella paurometabola DSM 20162]